MFYTTTLNMAVWTKLLDLPNAIVLDLDYDPADDILVAGTLGRGVWTYSNVSLLVPEPTLTLLAPLVLCLRRRRM